MEPYRLVIDLQPRYLHATVYGERTPMNARRFLEEAYAECRARGVDALLLDVRFSGPSLGIGSIHGIISDRSMDGAMLKRIAYVEAADEAPEKSRFAEMVAVNRGVNVRLFDDLETAREWLTQGAGAPPR